VVARQASRARPVDLLAIESLLPPDKQAIVERSRLAFHRSFDVARMGQRMVKDIIPASSDASPTAPTAP